MIALVGTSRVLALSIGAALDTNSRIGREQKIALEVAARRFNASSQALLLTIKELKSSDTLQASNDGTIYMYSCFLSSLSRNFTVFFFTWSLCSIISSN